MNDKKRLIECLELLKCNNLTPDEANNLVTEIQELYDKANYLGYQEAMRNASKILDNNN